MSDSRENQVLQALTKVQDPDLHRDIVALGFVKNLTIDGDDVSFEIELTTPACPVKDLMKSQAEAAVRELAWPKNVSIAMTASVRATSDPAAELTIKNIVSVASGKGGVGKSTVALNLAFALAKTGTNVGILDADLYGPSIPHMLGIQDKKPETTTIDGRQRIMPVECRGVKVMSMGFLVEVDRPLIWRGPMLHGALQQFFSEVEWGDLDYLIIDLPPGTGDVQLTLAQKIKGSSAVLVSTPQDVAMIDARKALNMFRQVNVPVLGVVENMSGFVCPHCGEETPIFGSDGAKQWAEKEGLRFLGAIPIDLSVRVHGDDGIPAVLAEDTNPQVQRAFQSTAEQTAAELSRLHLTQPAPGALELHND